MKAYQIMSGSLTIAVVKANGPREAIQKAVENGKLIAGTWQSFEIKDGFRIILK